MTVSIIDSPVALVSFLNKLENQPINPPSLYLDIEGVALSRHGSISIIQLFHLPLNHVFLIDVFVLQGAAFNTPNKTGTTLRSILESALVPKVFFDVRNDADALYAHFNISLQGVHDIQLLEVATRSWAKDRVVGLRQCIRSDARLTTRAQKDWEAMKARGKALFATEDGGSYEVFNIRPMLQDIIDYCAQDVVYLPVLWNVYSRKISKKWLKRVQEETVKRVLMSQAESYEPHGEHKVLSPWANTPKDRERNCHAKNGGREIEKTELDGERNCHAKSGGREIEKTEIVGVRGTEKRGKVSAAQVVAAKAAHRKAEKQLVGSLIRQWPTGGIEPQASKQMAHLTAVQVTPTVINAVHERPSPLVNLPTRSKAAPPDKATATHNKVIDSNWICTTCNRTMLKTQQQDHLAGKAHIARSKQVPITPASAPLQPTIANEGSSLQAANITKPKSQKAKAKPATKPPQGNPNKVGSKSTKRRSGTATYSQPSTHFSSDWGFVGFEQNWSAAGSSSAYDGYYSGGGDNYGICDKDCGWCGYCMDGVDI